MEPNETPEVAEVPETSPQDVLHEPPQPEDGDRMKKMRRVLFISVPVALIALLGLSLLTYSPPSDAKPKVSWSPRSLYGEVGAGQSTTTYATFTANEYASDIAVHVVPEIAPYVSVSPSFFTQVTQGMQYDVEVTFSASADAPLGLTDGTIQLLQGRRTLAQPLPVVVEIVWPTFEGGEELGFSIEYPPGWNMQTFEDGIEFRGPEDYFFNLTVRRGVNPEEISPSQWFNQYLKPYLDGRDSSEQELIIDGYSGIEVRITAPEETNSHIYVSRGSDIIELIYEMDHPEYLAVYDDIINSVSIDP